ncbi:MAG: EpsG family protein [Rikenellaceae bacterium]
MFDFIPIYLYTPVFNYLILILVLGVFVKTQAQDIFLKQAQESYIGIVLCFVMILYMGLRPISGYYFGDTGNYASSYYFMQSNLHNAYDIFGDRDWVFNGLMRLFAFFSDVHGFFVFCAAVYVLSIYVAMRNFFGYRYYIPLIVAMSMFTFWSYGTNGIRNGMAASVAILALSYRPRYILMLILSVIAVGIHTSMGITVVSAVAALYVRNPKIYLGVWLLSVMSSLFRGAYLANLITATGFVGMDTITSYMNNTDFNYQFSQLGFRWDFLLYSSIPIVVGCCFIFLYNYKDTIYIWLFNIYLVTNAFWVIFIESAFSNRFAQISWFIMPLVLIYPFMSQRFWSDQSKKVGIAVVIFYIFTFYSNIIQGY